MSVSTPPIFAYFTNPIIRDHSGVTAVWSVAALELATMAFMRFLDVAESGAVGYDCRDPRIGHGGYVVTNPFQAVSEAASTTMSRLSLSLDAPLTLQTLIWRINFLLRSTDRPYIRAIFGFGIPLVMIWSINFLPLRSTCTSLCPVANLPVCRCSLHA